jgi:hypothetical protein
MSYDISQFAEAHAKAIASGELDTALQDFSAEFAPKVPSMVPLLPEGLNAAEVLSIEMRGSDHVIRTRYDGSTASATVEAVWREDGGRPKIVDAKFL